MKIFLAIIPAIFCAFLSVAFGKGLFDNPVTLFSESLLPCLSHAERAKVQTTSRGFYFRADTQPGFKNEYSPSDSGIYLDVAVRDPEEIPAFKDSSITDGLITKRTVEIPAPKTDQVTLRISFYFGLSANKESISSIEASIQKIIKASEQDGADQPATAPESKPEGNHDPKPEPEVRPNITLDEAKKNGMWDTLESYIKHNSVIADICVYEQEWIPPLKPFSKGQLVQRAVVTHSYCGSWKVGQQIEYTHSIEDAPRFFGRFRSTIPGKLKTFFCDPDGSEVREGGMIRIDGDGHWGFSRIDDVFAELFALELDSNPKLKTKANKAEQATPRKPSD